MKQQKHIRLREYDCTCDLTATNDYGFAKFANILMSPKSDDLDDICRDFRQCSILEILNII